MIEVLHQYWSVTSPELLRDVEAASERIASLSRRSSESHLSQLPMPFFDLDVESGDHVKPKYFPPIDEDVLARTLQKTLNARMAAPPGEKSKLLVTSDVTRHVALIVRALLLPSKGLLLLGSASSGISTLVQMAALVCSVRMEVFRCGEEGWRRTLCRVLRGAGMEGREQLLLLTEGEEQPGEELKDLHILLSNGSLPNLWNAEDMANIERVGPTSSSSVPWLM